MAKELKIDQPIELGDVTASPYVSAGIGDEANAKLGLHFQGTTGMVDPYADMAEVAKLKNGEIALSTHVEVGAHIHVSDDVEITAAVSRNEPQHGTAENAVSVGVKWSF